VIEDEIVSLGSSDGQLTLEVGDPRNAEIDVMDLELFHESVANYTGWRMAIGEWRLASGEGGANRHAPSAIRQPGESYNRLTFRA
jgi:hypothetical protein